MSHVSEATTSIKDLTVLKQTLKELGYGFYEGQKIQGQYLGSGINVDLVIDNKGNKNIGMVKNSEGTYTFKGDFWQINKTAFCNGIVQKYTVNKIRAELRKKKISTVSQSVEKNGDVKLVANF